VPEGQKKRTGGRRKKEEEEEQSKQESMKKSGGREGDRGQCAVATADRVYKAIINIRKGEKLKQFLFLKRNSCSWKTESRFNRLREHRCNLVQNLLLRHIEASCLLFLLRGPALVDGPRSFPTDILLVLVRGYHSNGLLPDRHCRGFEELGRLDSAFILFQPAARMLALQRISQVIRY
jgi:hypothetical protein